MSNPENLTRFLYGGAWREVTFVGTEKVCPGVECDSYRFVDGTLNADLGVIRMSEGAATRRQRVNLDPDLPVLLTEEGWLGGTGRLSIERVNGAWDIYMVNAQTREFSANVEPGEVMQWVAGKDGLMAYEICSPPYQRGRFVDLD